MNPLVPLDLDAICQKCLEKSAARRYRSADELADELQAFVEGRPVSARPVSTITRLVRWCRRHPLAFALQCVSATALVAISLLAWRANAATLLAGVSNDALKTTNTQLVSRTNELQSANREKDGLAQDAQAGQYDLMLDRGRRAFADRRFGDVPNQLQFAPATQVGWETQRLRYASRLGLPEVTAKLGEHDGAILDAVLSPDGRQLVSCGAEGLMLVWNLDTHCRERTLLAGRWSDRAMRRLRWHEGWPAETAWPPALLCPADVEWLGAGTTIAAASLDGQGLLIDTATGETKRLWNANDSLYAVAATPDGSRVLFGGRAGTLALCDPTAEVPVLRTHELGTGVLVAKFIPQAGWLIGCEDGRLLMLDEEQLTARAETKLGAAVWCFDVQSQGADCEIVVGCGEPRWRTFEYRNIDPPAFRLTDVEHAPHDDDTLHREIHAIRFGRGGHEVSALDSLGRLWVWDRDTRRLLWSTCDYPTSDRLQQLAESVANRNWPLARPLERMGTIAAYRVLETDGHHDDKVVTGGRELIVGCQQMAVRSFRWQPRDGRTVLTLPVESRIVFDRQQPELLWCLGRDGQLRVVESKSSLVQATVQATVEAHEPGEGALAPHARSNEVLTVGVDGALRSWRLTPKGLERGQWDHQHDRPLLSVACSPDGSLVAAEGRLGYFAWRQDRQQLVRYELHEDRWTATTLKGAGPDSPYACMARLDANQRPMLVTAGDEGTSVVVRVHRVASNHVEGE